MEKAGAHMTEYDPDNPTPPREPAEDAAAREAVTPEMHAVYLCRELPLDQIEPSLLKRFQRLCAAAFRHVHQDAYERGKAEGAAEERAAKDFAYSERNRDG